MRVTPRLLLLAGVAIVSVGVVADTLPASQIPVNFLLGGAVQAPETQATAAPAALETGKAVNGSLYAVVAPTYNGTGGTSSYLRLFNGGSVAATFSVNVVGSPSGNSYGVATFQVPVRGAPQYAMSEVLTAAGAGELSGGDTTYSLYIQSSESTAGYQHVTYNSVNQFFENSSSCTYALNQTIKSVANSIVLTNIHTSLFPTYPSQIEIHNYWNAPVNYTVTVIEARTGVIKGQTTLSLGANTTSIQPFTYYQNAVGWTPGGGELHANLVVTDPSGVYPAVTVGQSIINQTVSSALVNMSTACAVNAPVVSSGGGGDGGSGGGGITY
jgi:hypothetical protein